jgi:hypothetical protein
VNFSVYSLFEHEILGAFSPKPRESDKIYEMHESLFAEGFPGKQQEAVLSVCYIENVSL